MFSTAIRSGTRSRWIFLALVLAGLVAAVLVTTVVVGRSGDTSTARASPAVARHRVPGESYQICDERTRYLTSPWTFHALSTGSRTYTVAQYEALPGYGTTLPPLPRYIAGEGQKSEAAIIYAPGSATNAPVHESPGTPILRFFEGGAYGQISMQSISGDEFIGGSAPGYPEPTFDDGGNAGGISAENDSYGFSGGASTLAAPVSAGERRVITSRPIPGYPDHISFADGTTYQIASRSGTVITLAVPLRSTLAVGSPVWAGRRAPIAWLSAPALQGATIVSIGSSNVPSVPGGTVVIGAGNYQVKSVSGTPNAHTLTLVGGLDLAARTNTPVYYGDLAGGVSVEFLEITHDLHTTTGTIYTGSNWTIEHNYIHDSYSTPGQGVAIYGGDRSTIEYNCLSKMGDYGANIFGANDILKYNEIYDSNYRPDPGCGCSGGGKWWATLNADIVDNAFVDDGPGGGVAIWLDNGNTGTLIAGNYFYESYRSAIESETGYNLKVTNNLFLDDGWGKGDGGCGSNCDGAVSLNSSGGFNIPGSRYENEITVTDDQFINDWMGVDIWQAGQRSCENSGEGWPNDAAYCSGGFPNSASGGRKEQYYFSHLGDSAARRTSTLAQSVAAGDSTILVSGPEAIDDQLGFGDPVGTKTTDTTDVSHLTGHGTVRANTAGFPSSGQIRVGTSTAWSNGHGSYTGAILSYTGKTSTSFTDVSLVRGSGALTGPILAIQPYKVTAEKCYANDCSVTISPALAAPELSGAVVTNAGTCQLYATSSALPAGPRAPDGISYWDGCQWEARHILIAQNTFVFQPSVIGRSAPQTGGTTTTCTAAHTNSCGTNFMAYQVSGEAPFGTQIAANALMSNSAFTGCPSWDANCANDPLSNLNVHARSFDAVASNGAEPADNRWTNNVYIGPWGWNAYLYGTCGPRPTDPVTGKSIPADACATLGFSRWQSYWQQDTSSVDTRQAPPASGRPGSRPPARR